MKSKQIYNIPMSEIQTFISFSRLFWTKKKLLVINSIKAIMIKEIAEQQYNIKNIYISNERVFLSLGGFTMKKSLSERIYLKINLL